ncbi:MAG: acyclic terpene utilization AtuA family protein, partial [Candidatus Acidiferrales bacterium]
SGAGYSGDRVDPAVELAQKGDISYLVFECLAERTIALAQESRLRNRSPGYDPLLQERMEAILPVCAQKKIRIISNMGAANPLAAAEKTREVAQQLGIHGLRIAAITGDDVTTLINDKSATGISLVTCSPRKLVSANAYLGAEPIIEALTERADVILMGRVADPSMFLAPLVYEFGWSMEDWDLLGQGTVIGHLLECAGQVTGGYFADPGYKDVPNLAHLGFPLAEVSEDGQATITKVEGSGGCITKATCTEQLLYEIQDPSGYFTPDVIADFSHVSIESDGLDRMRVYGGRGKPRPATLKVSVGYHDGYLGEAQISYAGPGALRRAKLAREILTERLRDIDLEELRFDFVGIDSILPRKLSGMECEPNEVRLRVAGRSQSMRAASTIHREVEALYTNGPAGGGGVVGTTKETIGIASTLVPRDMVPHRIHYEVS